MCRLVKGAVAFVACALLFLGCREALETGEVQAHSGYARMKCIATSDGCFQKHLVDRYASRPDAEWKNDAMDHVRESAHWYLRLHHGLAGGSGRRIAMSAAHYKTASKLVERGCDWPYVRMEAAIWRFGDFSEGGTVRRPSSRAFKEVRSLRNELMSSGATSALERYLIAEAASDFLFMDSDFDVHVKAFVDLVREMPPDNDTSVFLWAVMECNRTLLNGASVSRIVESGAVSNEWFSQMLKGRALYTQAWARRGTGWANTVTKDGWRDYDELRKEAAACFDRAARILPGVPFAYHQKMQSLVGDAGAGRGLLDRVISCDPEYAGAYASYLWSCRPRWCGSRGKLTAFGDEMLEKGRPGSVMQLQYVHARLSVADELHERWQEAFWEEGVYSNMVSVVESALDREDLYVVTKSLLLQTLLYPAYANGDYRKMGEVAEKVWQMSPFLVCANNYGISASRSDFMKTVGLAFSEDADGELANAEKAMRDGRFGVARERFVRMLGSRGEGAPNTNALEYAASQVVAADSRLAQKGGKPYSLMPMYAPRFGMFSFWKTPAGRVVPTADGWRVPAKASMSVSMPVLPSEGAVEIRFHRIRKGTFIMGMNIGAWNEFHPAVGAYKDGNASAGLCRHTRGDLQHWGIKGKDHKPVELASGTNVLKLVYEGRKVRRCKAFLNGKELPWLSRTIDEIPERCTTIITAENVLIEGIEACAL